MSRAASSPPFGDLVQDFFCQRLMAQRNASPQTIASYRDAFALFVRFLRDHRRKPPESICLTDLDAPMVLEFLEHLERDRNNSIRTRNARLAALRSFFRYVAVRDPASLAIVQRVLAIPMKRHDRPLLSFLSRAEVDAVMAAPDRATWSGRRDAVLLAVLYNTGARVSEIVSLRVCDFTPGPAASVRLRGKGRKERRVPLWKSTAKLVKSWLAEETGPPDRPLFPNRFRNRMSRSGVASRLRQAVATASAHAPTLRARRVSPHTIRHTTAMHLLQAGVDITVIALWLGHESPTTTHGYVEADLGMKRRALDKVTEPTQEKRRFVPSSKLLAFLERL